MLLILLLNAPRVGAAFREGAKPNKKKIESFRVCLVSSPNLPGEPVNTATSMLYDCKDQVIHAPQYRARANTRPQSKAAHSRHVHLFYFYTNQLQSLASQADVPTPIGYVSYVCGPEKAVIPDNYQHCSEHMVFGNNALAYLYVWDEGPGVMRFPDVVSTFGNFPKPRSIKTIAVEQEGVSGHVCEGRGGIIIVKSVHSQSTCAHHNHFLSLTFCRMGPFIPLPTW
jgi:hypothetical protein